MKIYFERSGGFMGTTVSTFIDTGELPPEEAARLLELIQDVDFFTLDETELESVPSMTDQYVYTVTAEVAGVEHTVCLHEGSAPDELQPLLRQLTIIARRRARSDSRPRDETDV